MTTTTKLVVLDTCVLLKPRLSDVIMDLRAEKLFFAHWSENIDDEFMRNMQGIYGVPEKAAARRLLAMKGRCPEWEVVISSADFSAVPKAVDEKDRHVAAAALALRHAASRDTEADAPGSAFDVVLLTDNVRDMAKVQLKKLGVRVLHPGPFLDEVYATNPTASTRAVLRAAADLKKPPYTVEELLHALGKTGAKGLVAQMSRELSLTPSKARKPKHST